MQYFQSPYFYVAVAVGAGFFRATTRFTKLPPNAVLAILSGGFVLAFFGLDAVALGCVSVALAINFAAARFFSRVRGEAAPALNRLVLIATIAFDLALLGLGKYRGAAPVPAFARFALGTASVYPLRIIGVSYLTFKLIHYLLETYNRPGRQTALWTYLSFMVFFPTFVSGPIDRIERFSGDVAALDDFRLDAQTFNAALYRIATGLCRKLAATVLMPYTIGAMPADRYATASLAEMLLGIYVFTGVLYLDFSGYTDLAIGVGRLFGIRAPENFNNPFRSLSIQEYWGRWHITLSLWIRDYLFFPMASFLSRTWLGTWPAVVPVIAFFIAFTLCGLWHGESANFVAWGALNGLGLGAYAFYRELMSRPSMRPVYKRLSSSRAWIGVAWLTTMTFVAMVNVFFVLDWERALAVLGRLTGAAAP
jgi:alginate O-acetyltransferase complex protein AlgI